MRKHKLLVALATSSIALTTTMPLVSTLTSCTKDYSKNYSQEVKAVLNKLVEMNKNPRCTSTGVRKNLDAVRNFLAQEALSLGVNIEDIHIDSYGNMWFDVPASNGCENYKPLILQGHMDMVVAGLTKETQAITPIDVEIDWKHGIVHSKNYKTSLGADDGFGCCLALAICHDKSIEHGPLRLLFTADEDSGMLGAGKLKDENPTTQVLSYMSLPSGNKSIKYLLNIDAEEYAGVYRSCAGSATYTLNLSLNAEKQNQLNNKFAISIKGLIGGHSGDALVKNRANADKMAFEILKALNSNQIQIVKHYHPNPNDRSEDIVFKRNQVVAHSEVLVNTSLSQDSIQEVINTKVNEWKTKYTGDDWSKVSVTVSPSSEDHSKFISTYNSEILIKKLGDNTTPNQDSPLPVEDRGLWYGYVSNGKGGYKYSANLAPVNIYLNSENTYLVEINSQVRASTNEYLNFIRSYTQPIEIMEGLDERSWYPAWETTESNEMVQLAKKGYLDQGIEPDIIDCTGGVEPTWWVNANPNLNCTAVGARIDDPHSTKETLYIDTIQPVWNTTVSVIKAMKNN